MSILTRLRNSWNVFMGRDPTENIPPVYGGYSYAYRPDRVVLTRGNERSIINSIYNRIANDVAATKICHAMVDDNGKFLSERSSGLNDCLSLSANLDQTGRELIRDIVLSMIDEGVVAVVITDADYDPNNTSSFDICELKVGKITEWYPQQVRVNIYNELEGRKEDIIVEKRNTAIITNPFYSVMNEPNSTLQRLIRKLNLLDNMDEQSASDKLNLIIQLPYVIKSEARRQQAELRRKDIEQQLADSKYGIAYTDGTEHITQLNRSIENDLPSQIETLTNLLYAQLGITQSIMDGSANENVMLNYYSRTIEPIVAAIVDEFKRKFLTKTARTQGQSIWFFRDPFKLVPVTQIADIADKFTRNEILSSNEVRAIIGYKPVDDDAANELRNKNLNREADAPPSPNVVSDSDSEPNINL